MPVVTIRGQLGSGGPEVGRLVADRLNADFVDRRIIAEVAAILDRRRRDVKEKEMPPGSLLGRIAELLGRSYFLGVDNLGMFMPVSEIPLNDTRYLEGLRSVIGNLAFSQAIVLYGRGSQFILKDHPTAFHVLVVAPLDLRVKRVVEDMNLNEDAAKKEIERYDSSRREFIKRYFQAKLEDPVNYDLVINTEHLGFDEAASIVVNALPFKGKTDL